MLYQFIFHTLLRRVDAERAHRVSFAGLRALAAVPGTTRLMRRVLGPREP